MTIEPVARHLLGAENRALSTRRELRYGRRGSLSVDLRKNVWRDHEAGTGGGIFDLCVREGVAKTRAEAAEWLKRFGVEPPEGSPKPADPGSRSSRPRLDPLHRARILWRTSCDPRGTLAERYLVEERKLALPNDVRDIRFHPRLWLVEQGRFVAGLVCAFRTIRGDDLRAVHRIFLDENGRALRDGSGKRIKKMLGPAKDCAIKLSPDEEVEQGLGICEGIETGLGVLARGWRPIWALGSSGAVERFPVLRGIEHLTIFADADKAGLEAARVCRDRWRKAGAEAVIRKRNTEGADFGDLP